MINNIIVIYTNSFYKIMNICLMINFKVITATN